MILDTSSTGEIQLETSVPIEGRNRVRFQTKFADTSEITFLDRFVLGADTITGAWTSDGGDASAPFDTRERRFFCIKGKATYTFVGTSVAIRTSVNPGWGTATVLIDGVTPTSIAGAVRGKNTITCNAETLGLAGNEYIDQVVVDSLAPGSHTIEIICNNTSTQAFFVMSGIRAYDANLASVSQTLWAVDWDQRAQDLDLRLKMLGGTNAIEVSAVFSPSLLDAAGVAMGTRTAALVTSSTFVDFNTRVNTSSSSPALSDTSTIAVSYLVPADSGVDRTVTSSIAYDDPRITYGGAWFAINDPLVITEPVFSCENKSAFALLPGGNNMVIRAWTDFGIGIARIFIDGIIKTGSKVTSASADITVTSTTGLAVGMSVVHNRFPITAVISSIAGTTVTASVNATGSTNNTPVAFGNYVQEINTTQTNPALERTFQNFALTGVPVGYTGNVLLQCKTNNKTFSYTGFSLSETKTYAPITKTFTIASTLQQVLPSPVVTVALESGKVAFTPPNPASSSALGVLPFDNLSVDRYEVEYRFPTFICCYSAGFLDVFKQYDIVITDPAALTRAEVRELQDLGIEVYMYVSFGEEDGDPINKWDQESPLGPHTGNGLGPGGSAGYYMKNGYQYGEFSECTNDRQRMEGVKACAKSNPKYYAGTGRCTNACGNDWIDGYYDWQLGLKCGGGYTKNNQWQRDASTACTNATCPKFAPMHAVCSQYEQAENVYGQDFSAAATTKPDENGIWKSYYINTITRGPGTWYDKLNNFYLPLIFGEPVAKTEDLVVGSYPLIVTGNVLGVEVSSALDEGLPIEVKDKTTGWVYTSGVDYTFNKMSGIFILTPDADSTVPGYVLPSVGQVVTISFSSRGSGADGVFMDTVDTADIYPAPEFQQGFADLINGLKSEWSTKKFCSNRGFAIYDKIIKSCSLVMTESVFSDYNFNTLTYQEVSPEAAEYNKQVALMIQDLRRTHTFDVVCLNYAPNGAEGDAIRASVREKVLALGWMPWLSTILLNDPLPNGEFTTPGGYIRSNRWKKTRVIPIRPVP